MGIFDTDSAYSGNPTGMSGVGTNLGIAGQASNQAQQLLQSGYGTFSKPDKTHEELVQENMPKYSVPVQLHYNIETSELSADVSMPSGEQQHMGSQQSGDVPWYRSEELQFCISTIGSGLASYFTGQAKSKALKAQAACYEASASYARVNQRLAKTNIMYAYESGAYEAMVQGQKDAQQIALTRTQAASRGVRLNTGSTAEIEASQKINAKINQIKIQQNTTARINNARMQLAQAKGQELTALANAEAARIMAGTWGGFGSFVIGALQGASTYLRQENKAGLDLFGFNSWFNTTFGSSES